ncbi:hypothetical protein V5O48_003482 [Marasmius crinis-equi]|uniref:Uncharacterized protein n=1 Tax=Marasmius crinis-equi TaxID=585013 RepID=A0ABR3FSN4_9AGAR
MKVCQSFVLPNIRQLTLSSAIPVLTLLIVNIDNLKASQYDTVFKSAGLDTLSYVPESSPLTASAWPTLGSMIDNGTRLVTFLDNQADSTSVRYLIDEFTNMWETEFNVVDIARFDCTVNRTKGDTSTQLFLINHFLDQVIATFPAPFPAKANVTNAASGDGSLGKHVETCKGVMGGRSPNFLLLDFYEFAGTAPFEVAAQANGVQYNGKSIASPVITGSGSASSPTGTGSGSNGALSLTEGPSSSILLSLSCGFIAGASLLL